MIIRLPVSKSIANRLLILQAMHNMPLTDVYGQDIPDDVKLMHNAIRSIHSGAKRIDLQNCGTAMRFLTAYCAQREGHTIILNGSERMRQRPVRQLVNALRTCGADVTYISTEGFPPLQITGKHLNHALPVSVSADISTQFASALLLIGMDVTCNSTSPYIAMTRDIISRWQAGDRNYMERDWSAAAFWYEYVALHGTEIFLTGLHADDIQGDKAVFDIFSHLGVTTTFETDGVRLTKTNSPAMNDFSVSFKNCPDLYPAVAVTCRRLGIRLHASGTDALPYKESNRLIAVEQMKTYSDHRIAMALLAAGLPCDDSTCINKSYPAFYEQLCQLQS